MTKIQITDRQKEVYDLIQSLISQRGYGPTVREIGEHFGIKSPNGVMCHLRALERKGLITRKANKSRAIELTGEHSRSKTGMPLAGVVATTPSAVDLQSTTAIDLGTSLATGHVAGARFAVRVSGDALRNRGILDGDYVIIESATSSDDGALSLVEIQDQQCLLRYAFADAGRMTLRAAHAEVKDVVTNLASIVGVAKAVVRLEL